MTDSQPQPAVSNLRVMHALLAKDWRFFRAPIVALLLLCAGCYLTALTQTRVSRSEIYYSPLIDQATEGLMTGAQLSLMLCALLAAAFGGVAIAGERAARSADFLAALPITRRQIVLSKCITSASALGAFTALHTAVLLFALHFSGQPAERGGAWKLAVSSAIWLGFTVSFFGAAWLLSTFTRSGPISACVSIAITIAVFVLALVYLQGHDRADYMQLVRHLVLPPLAIGLASLISGTLYYLRRVEP